MEQQARLNCWEIKNCGREIGGSKVADLGVCPVSVEHRADGIHHGSNAGRCCWVVSGLLCKGGQQGTHAEKSDNCGTCNVYETVKREEQAGFKVGIVILNEIKRRAA